MFYQLKQNDCDLPDSTSFLTTVQHFNKVLYALWKTVLEPVKENNILYVCNINKIKSNILSPSGYTYTTKEVSTETKNLLQLYLTGTVGQYLYQLDLIVTIQTAPSNSDKNKNNNKVTQPLYTVHSVSCAIFYFRTALSYLRVFSSSSHCLNQMRHLCSSSKLSANIREVRQKQQRDNKKV